MSFSPALLQSEVNTLGLLIAALDAGAKPDLLLTDSIKTELETLLHGSLPKDPLELSLALENLLLDSRFLIASQEGFDIKTVRKIATVMSRVGMLASAASLALNNTKITLLIGGFGLLSSAVEIGSIVHLLKGPYVAPKHWFEETLSELTKLEGELEKFTQRCYIDPHRLTQSDLTELNDYHERRVKEVFTLEDRCSKLLSDVPGLRVKITESHLNAQFCISVKASVVKALDKLKVICKKQEDYSAKLNAEAQKTGNKLYEKYAKATEEFFYDFSHHGITTVCEYILRELTRVEKVVTKLGQEYQTFKDKEDHN